MSRVKYDSIAGRLGGMGPRLNSQPLNPEPLNPELIINNQLLIINCYPLIINHYLFNP